MDLQEWLGHQAVDWNRRWTGGYGPYTPHPSLAVDEERLAEVFARFSERLEDNYPFFHPRYAGQMLKPPHPVAVVGYLTAMLINPNNHALDGGPATARMEREVVQQLADMFGLPTHLGHLATSGTIANLEALFVARELHPGRGVAHSADAHYTHGRMCSVLRIDAHAVPVDGLGRMDLTALEELLRTGRVGTVVATAGTTGLGAIDPVHEILTLARQYDVRVHVDGAYGGFYTLLANDSSGQDGAAEPFPESLPAAPWRAIAECDSVVVDPHKHGLQPYGCGAVIFRDPSVGRFYLHDSPYTYFTSDELHLGEISLECSRAGAAAAAAWLTYQLIPLTRDGLGQALAACRRAALRWARAIEESEVLELFQQPELDILTYFPAGAGSLAATDHACARLLRLGMAESDDQVFLSTLRVSAEAARARKIALTEDAENMRVIRSVLMKPEQEDYVAYLHARLEQLARAVA